MKKGSDGEKVNKQNGMPMQFQQFINYNNYNF